MAAVTCGPARTIRRAALSSRLACTWAIQPKCSWAKLPVNCSRIWHCVKCI